jgi:hypothetical protein
MTGLQPSSALSRVIGALLATSAVVWIMGRRTRGKTVLFVLNGEKPILEAKVPVLAQVLCARMMARGFSIFRARKTATIRLNEKPDGDTAILQQARGRGADYALVVSLNDLGCQVDESRSWNLETLRMNTMLCADYQMLEVVSGRVLACQTLALCRITPPIVSGTSVGSDILDKLLGEVADRITGHIESLQLAV